MAEIPGTMPDPKRRSRGAAHRTSIGPILPAKSEQGKKRNPAPRGWVSWWPAAASLALGCLAPLLRNLLAAWEPWGMRTIFPFVLVAGRLEIGMRSAERRPLQLSNTSFTERQMGSFSEERLASLLTDVENASN